MKKEQQDNLILRFLNNELTDVEKSTVLDWVQESKENQIEFKRIHQIHQAKELNQMDEFIKLDSAWSKLKSKFPSSDKTKLIQLKNIWRVAASVAILICLGLSAYIVSLNQQQTGSAFVQFESPKGEKSKVVLADGTLVWLNSESTMKYDAIHGRKVYLEGEAYFDVFHDPAKVFEVETYFGYKVEVLGTKFNLKAYASENLIETTLEEGKVHFVSKNDKLLRELKPGEQASYSVTSDQLIVGMVDTELYSLWKDNILKFDNILMEDLIKRMERWYGVSIKIDEELRSTARFTMTIKTESLRELLTMMQFTANFDYSINGEQVTISKK